MGSVLLGRCKIARYFGQCPTTFFPAHKGFLSVRGDANAAFGAAMIGLVGVQYVIRRFAVEPIHIGIDLGPGLG